VKFGTKDLHVMPFGLGRKFHVFINPVSNGDKRPSFDLFMPFPRTASASLHKASLADARDQTLHKQHT